MADGPILRPKSTGRLASLPQLELELELEVCSFVDIVIHKFSKFALKCLFSVPKFRFLGF